MTPCAIGPDLAAGEPPERSPRGCAASEYGDGDDAMRSEVLDKNHLDPRPAVPADTISYRRGWRCCETCESNPFVLGWGVHHEAFSRGVADRLQFEQRDLVAEDRRRLGMKEAR